MSFLKGPNLRLDNNPGTFDVTNCSGCEFNNYTDLIGNQGGFRNVINKMYVCWWELNHSSSTNATMNDCKATRNVTRKKCNMSDIDSAQC